MSGLGDATDVGVLLSWAARPREVPARHEEYQRVVCRYRAEPDFAALADATLSGAGLSMIVDDRDGAVVTALPTSPLRYTVGDIMKRVQQPQQRALLGVILLGIARTAYPEPGMVDDPGHVAVFTTLTVVDTLDRAAQAHAEAADTDGAVDDRAVEVWRHWQALVTTRPNAQRFSASDRIGFVRKACKFLVEVGYLTARGETDSGTWVGRPRFRHAVAELGGDEELYRIVNDLDIGDEVATGDG